ncbi:MAG: S8 family serine peptidase [Patescibacteria group bacterium]
MTTKMTSFFICFLVLATVFLFAPFARAITNNRLANTKMGVINEILVKYRGDENIVKVKLSKNEEIKSIIEKYKRDPQVEYAEPNYLYHSSIIPNDIYYSNQWYLEKVRATDAWEKVAKSPNIVIAIIDSGIQINHPDLENNIWKNFDEISNNNIDDDQNGFIDDRIGWDFINNTPDPSPKFEEGFTEAGIIHGTIVAGVAAAAGNNKEGGAGITWQSQIMPLRVLNDMGEGRVSEVVRAIDYSIANGADIINLSFVGFGYSQTMFEAIERAYKAGIVIVAAAGNEQDEGEGYNLDEIPMYPVCHDGVNGENMVIGVAATDTLDQKSSFSSFGIKCVDIAAPGVSIFSTVVYEPTKRINEKSFNKYYDGYWAGTSMATPMVSGAVALIEAINPKMNRNQVIKTVLNSADNISRLNPRFIGQLGTGRLNVKSAIDKALEQLNNQTINLLVAPYSNYISQVKITDYNGEIKDSFNSYMENFLGGASVSSGDIDGDGKDEIVTGAGFSGGPHVRIFDNKGKVLGQFFAYDKNFRGGVNVAVGDVDGGVAHKKHEIITAAGKGGGPHVRIFDNEANLVDQFFAYQNNFREGVKVSSGDIDKDGLAEIITGAGPGGAPHVRVFEVDGKLIGSFYAYEAEFNGGVNVGVVGIEN